MFVSGLTADSSGVIGAAMTATYDSFPKGSTSTFTFQAVVKPDIAAYQTVTNTAQILYTSLPGKHRHRSLPTTQIRSSTPAIPPTPAARPTT